MSSRLHHVNQFQGPIQTNQHGEFSWTWMDPVWGAKSRMLFWFICCHSSDHRFSKVDCRISMYIHWIVAHEFTACGSISECIRKLHRFQIFGYLKLSDITMSPYFFFSFVFLPMSMWLLWLFQILWYLWMVNSVLNIVYAAVSLISIQSILVLFRICSLQAPLYYILFYYFSWQCVVN